MYFLRLARRFALGVKSCVNMENSGHHITFEIHSWDVLVFFDLGVFERIPVD